MPQTTNRTTEGAPTAPREPWAPGPESPRGGQAREDRRGIAELLKTLSRQSGTLVREEVALARVEMEEKLSVYQKSLGSLVVGAALAIAAVILLVEAVNRGLTALLEGWVSLEVAVWLAPLILALVVGGIGYGMIKGAMSAVKREGITPHATVDTLREDKEWAERKVRHE